MELMVESLKKNILDNYGKYLDEKNTDDVPLNMVSEKNITTDDIDTNKYSSETVMFVIPELVKYTSLSMDSELVEFETDIFIALRKYPVKTLYLQALRHGDAFKKMILENSSLNNVDFEMSSADYVQGVEGDENIKGVMVHVKMSIELIFE